PAYTPDKYSDCPQGRVCRQSDAALVYIPPLSLPTVYPSLIYKTKSRGRNHGSRKLAKHPFEVSQVDNFIIVGQINNKIGRTTGWTYGTLTWPCKNEAVYEIGNDGLEHDTGRTLLCQNEVRAGAGRG